MLNEEFFQVQLEYLKLGNIRAAVEMELTDIQAKFGSKYDDAINEARKYIAKLEEIVKIMKKNGA